MMLANICSKLNLSTTQCFIATATRAYVKKSDYLKPIIDKNELDNIQSEDLRHFQLIKSPDGFESNSINYNPRLHKFIKVLMRNGNSSLARNLVDKALYNVKLKQVERYNKADEAKKCEIETNPIKIFLGALDNTKPILKVTSLIKSGISYQVPVPMSEKEREFKSTNLILSSSLEKDRNVRFFERLATELIDAYMNQGKSIKKKVDIHKLAEANRAYAHFRWLKR